VSTVDEVADVCATEPAPTEGRPRNPWIAAALAIFCGATGLVYCGRLRRALLWLMGSLVVLLAVGCLLFYLPNGRVAWIAMALLVVAYPVGLLVDTIRIARRRERASRWYQRWWFYLGFAIAMSFFIDGAVHLCRTYWEEAFVVPSGGMSPTIQAGDRILVDKLRYRLMPIHHEDVVTYWIDEQRIPFYFSSDPQGRTRFVQRVVGLPGDSVEFRDEKLLRNGVAIEEPYAVFTPTPSPASEEIEARLKNTPPTVVGEGELFVVGDNRRASLDSRFFGCIPEEDVLGKVAIVYWSREPGIEDTEPASAADPARPAPEPSRRIRWERFGQRVE
jgi:signal peptidase I